MDMISLLSDSAKAQVKRALPVLSFPAVQKMGVTVKKLVSDSESQAEAMRIVARDTNTIAAVSLMDLSVEAEAFGANVRFADDEVPAIIGQLVKDEDDAKSLEVPSLEMGRARTCIKGIVLAKEKIADKPVLAGMIGPFSLAGRLMDVTEIMYACYDEPETVHMVLEKATAYLLNYAKALKEAGADGLVMAEPLAGLLSADMMDEFSKPYVKRLISAVQSDGFAVIYHNCGNSVLQMLDGIFSQGAAAYHFGNAVDMETVLKSAPSDAICMGNIDPAGQFAGGTVESIREATLSQLAKCAKYDNYIISSGCDIPAHSKWANIDAFFSAIDEFNAKKSR